MTIKLIYETQTGTTQYVAEAIQDRLLTAGHMVSLHSIKYQGNQPSLEGVEMVLFGAPTYDDGKLEKTMLAFISEFNPDLSQKKVAVFGLGNRSYPQFCISADILEQWVAKNNGQLLTESLRVDGFPNRLDGIDDFVRRLTSSLA